MSMNMHAGGVCMRRPATFGDCKARESATKIDGSAVVASDAALPTATLGGFRIPRQLDYINSIKNTPIWTAPGQKETARLPGPRSQAGHHYPSPPPPSRSAHSSSVANPRVVVGNRHSLAMGTNIYVTLHYLTWLSGLDCLPHILDVLATGLHRREQIGCSNSRRVS